MGVMVQGADWSDWIDGEGPDEERRVDWNKGSSSSFVSAGFSSSASSTSLTRRPVL